MDLSPPGQGPDTRIELPDGLTLRAFGGEEDLPEFFRVIDESVEHLGPWMPWVARHGHGETAAFLRGRAELWARGEQYSYAIVLDGAIVGSCGLHRLDDTPEGAIEIGYWLHPSATGRGLATRAARALVEQAFRLPGVTTVEIVHDTANHASAGVPARLGFDGDLRRPHEPTAPAETGEDRIWRLRKPAAQPS
ncbi:GNAT family N-acetyltransferase [Streptomyces tanashiensis]|uniref:GNAT family N-acetyltransferase n=1 Tax=Streptomyces tanashiensis TaxID=67367 RepID=A0ABY6R0H9_9ACTN|nr:GNAT family N-acetyltransferase [Streptomyces tanashiensis]UZX22422.1 GNAT family N-acetyltransferase [Streptomyces tanashiensis]